MKHAPAILIAVILAGSSTFAQGPQPPKPAPEVQRLNYFVGDWKREGKLNPGSGSSEGRFTATDHSEWMPGGFFLLSHSEYHTSGGTGWELYIMGYDPAEKVYTYYMFNDVGQRDFTKATVQGEIWTWDRGENSHPRERYTIKVLSPTSYLFKDELSSDGKNWKTVLEGKATKTK